MIEVESTTGVELAKKIDEAMQVFDVRFLKTHWIGLATDGASSLCGKINGAGTILKRKYPNITQIHCLAHR